MAFYREKGWWKSKTVWTGIVGTIIGVLTFFGMPLPVETSETIVGAIMAVIGVATIFFRGKADAKLVASEKA